MASLKQLNDKVMGESGFLIPTSYFGSLSPDDVQVAYLANAISDDIREFQPQVIRKSFSIVLTVATAYPLPSDFLGYVPDTCYTDGRMDPVFIPTTAAVWNQWLANNNPGGIQVRARFLAGQFQVLTPQVGTTVFFEYVSNAPWTSSDGLTAKEQADTDEDLCLIDRRLMELGIKALWKKEKGLPDWQIDEAKYLAMRNGWMARDQGAKTIMIGGPVWPEPAPQFNNWVTP